MHDELFGHCLAALRFGASAEGCKSAIGIAFELNPARAAVRGLLACCFVDGWQFCLLRSEKVADASAKLELERWMRIILGEGW